MFIGEVTVTQDLRLGMFPYLHTTGYTKCRGDSRQHANTCLNHEFP